MKSSDGLLDTTDASPDMAEPNAAEQRQHRRRRQNREILEQSLTTGPRDSTSNEALLCGDLGTQIGEAAAHIPMPEDHRPPNGPEARHRKRAPSETPYFSWPW